MSYWVSLSYEDGRECLVGSHSEGATFAIGGTSDPSLNVTYNYSKVYAPHGFSLRDLDGKRAGDFVQVLSRMVDRLDTDESSDYWEPTEGNARRALSTLLAWARQHPDATWSVN